MNHEEALLALHDSSPTTRLRAARRLLDIGTIGDSPAIHEARGRETDSWTRKMLDRVLLRLATGAEVSLPLNEPKEDDELVEGIQAQSLQVATRRIVHEVRPLLMAAFVSAEGDIGTKFAYSATNSRLKLIDDYLIALEHLGEAASAPNFDDLDITEIVDGCLRANNLGRNKAVPGRSDPVIARVDRALLQLALSNLIKNAVEASSTSTDPVVINWASSSEEAWVAVIDRGIGMPADGFSAAKKTGTTSKGSGHFGLGLPIADQAAMSMGGELTLRPNSGSGTIAEIRWPQYPESAASKF